MPALDEEEEEEEDESEDYSQEDGASEERKRSTRYKRKSDPHSMWLKKDLTAYDFREGEQTPSSREIIHYL